MNRYNFAEVKAAGDCYRYAIDVLHLAEASPGRFNCPWRPGSDSGGFAISQDSWYDHVAKEGGSIIDLVARSQFDGDLSRAQESLGQYYGLAPIESASKGERRVVATYDYQEADGKLLYQKIRYEPKDFRWRRPEENGGWNWRRGKAKIIPYRLPDWINSPYISIVEGEKDADNLHRIGVMATTAPDGAGKWPEALNEYFRDKIVIILIDNDEPGRQHGELVAYNLREVTSSLRILNLMPDKPGGDVSDWLADGGDKAKLKQIADRTPKLDQSAIQKPKTIPETKKGGSKREGKVNRAKQADLLIEIAQAAELFRTPGASDSEVYASFDTGGHRETWGIASKFFRRWLSGLFYRKYRKAPGSQALQDALNVIMARALFESHEYSIALRLAENNGDIWLDLADEEWRAVRISKNGWSIVQATENPVRFIRKRGQLHLPEPVHGGNLNELRPLLNLPDDDGWVLFVSYLIGCLEPNGPFPALILNGEQGTGKSFLCRATRSLVDPNKVALRRPPRDERDLMVAAENNWLVGLDNLSSIPDWLSDALCVLSTGGGFGTRELYSDGDEKLFSAKRPILVNGITEVVTRSDLVDRSIMLTLPPILDDRRRSEKELDMELKKMRPCVLGALLNAVSCGLKERDDVVLDEKPRMADFAVWVMACEPALPFDKGRFMDVYLENRSSSDVAVLDAAIIGHPILSFMESRGSSWEGSTTNLINELDTLADAKTKMQKEWPNTVQKMSRLLRRIAPNLRKLGINVEFPQRGNRKRILRLEKVCKPSSHTSPSSPKIHNRLINQPVTEQKKGDEGRPIGDEGDESGDEGRLKSDECFEGLVTTSTDYNSTRYNEKTPIGDEGDVCLPLCSKHDTSSAKDSGIQADIASIVEREVPS